MTDYAGSGDTLVALPGGGSVSVSFLAGQNVTGYSYLGSGQYSIAPDATLVGYGGLQFPVGSLAGIYGVTSKDPSQDQQAQQDAAKAAAANKANIVNLLHQFGLDELIPLVDGWVRSDLSWDEVEAQLYDRNTQAGKIVDRLYPELGLRQQSGLKPMSIADIQTYRQRAQQILAASGFSESFRTNDYIRRFIVGDMSLDELSGRASAITNYGAQLASDPQATTMLSAFQRYYGVRPTNAEIASMALDPKLTLPDLQRRMSVIGEDVAAQESGWGQLQKNEAESLVSAGVSDSAATDAFGRLVSSKELMTALPGLQNSEDTITREEQLGTVTGNANATRRIRQRAEARVAAFAGGGHFAQTKEGFTGVGVAR